MTGTGIPQTNPAPMKRKAFRQPVDHLALHEDVAQAVGDPEHPVGGDERRDAAEGDEQPVDASPQASPAQSAATMPHATWPWLISEAATAGGESPRTAPTDEIDAAGQDDDGQASRHQELQRGLPQHVDEVAPGEELRTQDRQHDDQQRDARSGATRRRTAGPWSRRRASPRQELVTSTLMSSASAENRAQPAKMMTTPTIATCHSVPTPSEIETVAQDADGERADYGAGDRRRGLSRTRCRRGSPPRSRRTRARRRSSGARRSCVPS